MKKKFLIVLVCCVGLITACGSKERNKLPQGATSVMNNNTTTSDESTSDVETTPEETTPEEPETTTEEIIPVWEREEYSFWIKPGQDNVLHYDIDNDGKDEIITLYAEEPEYSDYFPEVMLRITNGERVLFQTDSLLGGLLYEKSSYMYYIVREKGKNYLLEFWDTLHQGEDYRSYRLVEFFEDGSMKVADSASSDLSWRDTLNNTTDVDDAVKYYEKAMGYLERKDTILLYDLGVGFDNMVYSGDGNIKYADSRIERSVFERTIPTGNDDWNDISKFREKVKEHCDDAIAQIHFYD